MLMIKIGEGRAGGAVDGADLCVFRPVVVSRQEWLQQGNYAGLFDLRAVQHRENRGETLMQVAGV